MARRKQARQRKGKLTADYGAFRQASQLWLAEWLLGDRRNE